MAKAAIKKPGGSSAAWETSRLFFALGSARVVMLKRIAMILGIIVVSALIAFAYLVFTANTNDTGGEAPTACTVKTVQRDCQKLRCLNSIWVFYCDTRGIPQCSNEGKCECVYGCM